MSGDEWGIDVIGGFYVGLHQPADAKHFAKSFISVNRLRTRKSALKAGQWIMDSGAFTEIVTHGGYRSSTADYVREVNRWASSGELQAAVSQDWMCEPFTLNRTGLTVPEHQALTIQRYDELRGHGCNVYLMPVLQGYEPTEYVTHVRQYGNRLVDGQWVGVGSVCKRNTDPRAIERVLLAIKSERPDLLLHGFGLKFTALQSGLIRQLLHTADSMAWSYNARRNGRNANDWREAERFVQRVKSQQFQIPLF